MSLNLCYNLFIILSFRLLCTVVSLFYVCVVYRHVRIVLTCDRQLVTSAVRWSINADDLKKIITLINGELGCLKRRVVETEV